MKAETENDMDNNFVAPRDSFAYSIGKAYASHSHYFSCSQRIIKTNEDYYDSLKILGEMIQKGELPADTRFMTQAEGLAIEQCCQKEGKDPRKSDEFKDYFGKNSGWYAREWTLTGLRSPKSWENGKVDTKTGKYPRIVLIGDKECGVLQVPAGDGKLIVESDKVFGIPTETREISWPHEGYYAHWWFNTTPDVDKMSGHYDVAVVRRGDWPDAPGDERCIGISANSGRLNAISADSFRPVLGPLPIFGAFPIGAARKSSR